MCGRFTFTDPRALAEAYGVTGPIPEFAPRYNVAPSQAIPVIALKRDGLGRGVAMLKWGLVPHWAADPKSGPRPINVRAESLGSPTFRDAFRARRCLIPADGFYEWSTVGKKKIATHFRLASGAPFAFAGLWDFWTDGSERLATCAIITTEANAVVGAVHDRMPAIVPATRYAAWLSNETDPVERLDLLQPYPSDELVGRTVGSAVNSPRVDGPDCLGPTAPL